VADVPPELRECFAAHLARVEHLVPLWCSRVRVLYQSCPNEQEQGGNASICVNVEYREATLSILPRWLDRDDEGRHKTLVHEMSHFPTRQIFDLARTIVENAVSDEGMQAILKEQIRVASEAATEDTAQMILRCERRK
jgi:hypothetical protein